MDRRLGRTGLIALVAIIGAAAGFAFNNKNRAARIPTPAAEVRLLGLSLLDPDGHPQQVSQWRGRVILVNFWATWCEPCRDEVPALTRLQHRYVSNGLQIVGIAVDSPGKVQHFAKEYRIDYPILIGDAGTLGLIKDLGNRTAGLPFTVVIDRAGKVVKVHTGGMTEAELTGWLLPLLS